MFAKRQKQGSDQTPRVKMGHGKSVPEANSFACVIRELSMLRTEMAPVVNSETVMSTDSYYTKR